MIERTLHVLASAEASWGGPAAAIGAICEMDARLGRKSALLTTAISAEAHELLAASGVEVCVVPPPRLLGRAHLSPSIFSTLRRELAQEDHVIIHGVFDAVAVSAAIACRTASITYTVRPYGSLDEFDLKKHRRAKRLLSPLWRWMLGSASAVWFTASREAERSNLFGARAKEVVCPLPLASRAEDPPVQRHSGRALPRKGLAVLFLGRLHSKKGIERLIDAFALSAGIDDRLLIAGAGQQDYTSTLHERAAGSSAASQIDFLGWVQGEQKKALLDQCDLFVLASDNENFGVAVAEALKASLPTLLSSEVYLSDELELVGATYVCEPTLNSVADGLKRLLAEPDLRDAIATSGKDYVDRELSVECVSIQYAGFFQP